ncbi:MAG: hypothetical protein A3D57_04075 [Candidatus Sungbacteria bacterium RIFCSPHIGHO2_02_FULL_46_12]|nr:MAG: hypothetical protein A3D57_04075 [Candidatus Sungbacteria bacterium RIFCSPHIGHO2_02_FULL_46_12]
MALKDAQQYIEAHKSEYPLEALISQLRNAGYPEEELREAMRLNNGFSAPSVTGPRTINSSAPFPHPAMSTGKKILLWFGGFISASIVLAVLPGFFFINRFLSFGFGYGYGGYPIATILLPFLLIAGGVFIFLKFKKRSRHFAFGVLSAVILYGVGLLLILVLAFSLIGVFGRPHGNNRDARRVADVKQLQLALELYYDSSLGYPDELSNLAPTYIPSIPLDPATRLLYYYERRLDGSYYLRAELEDSTTPALRYDFDPSNTFYEVSETPTESQPESPQPATPAEKAEYFMMIYPNGGEVLRIGQSIQIKWNISRPVARVVLGIQKLSSKAGELPPAFTTIADGVPNTGTYAWKVGTYKGGTLASPGTYLVRVSETVGLNTQYDDSDFAFMIAK